jgi:glutamine synthetase
MTLKELTAEIESGAIDTIVVAFTDMQGRLMGKRAQSTTGMSRRVSW